MSSLQSPSLYSPKAILKSSLKECFFLLASLSNSPPNSLQNSQKDRRNSFLIGYRVFCHGYFILKVMPAGNKERLTLETNLLKSFSVTFVS